MVKKYAAVKWQYLSTRKGYEPEFQTELQKMRRHVKELFANMLPEPRIVEDITGKEGAKNLLSTPLWPGGPAWKDLPGNARPDLPTSTDETKNKTRVWDFWLTDYNPAFWQHTFGDCPLNVAGGKDLCPSPSGAQTAKDLCPSPGGKGLCPSPSGAQTVEDLWPRCSWFRYHGTGLHSALAAISMNTLNKSEAHRGRPAKNDTQARHSMEQGLKDFYETAVQRGVYSAASFFKAKQYGIPYAPGVEVSNITASFVLLLRVPGSLEKFGVHFRVADP